MSGLQFAELRPLVAESCSSSDPRCAMILSTKKGRCMQEISPRAGKVQELHDRLRADEDVDETAQAHVLKKIAKLTLCDAHSEAEDIAAAVEQWQSQIRARIRPAKSAAPKTPKAKKGTEERLIEFVSYTGTKSKIDPNDPEQIDAKIRDILTRKIAKQDKHVSYLYVFSQKFIKDKRFYKIGLTYDLPRRQTDLEKCYGPLELHCFVECPNVEMFEMVAHAELLQYRRKHSCEEETCDAREHTEWFEAPLADILDTVTAWSLYARLLYRCGSSLDGNNQSMPVPGWLTRPDRWRRFAMGEATRWMDEIPSNVTVVPEKEAPQSTTDTEAVDETDSEPESTFSTPASLSDTPATTPGTDPESYGDGNNDYGDYGLTPTPAVRHKIPDLVDEDDGGLGNRAYRPAKRVERRLSFASMRRRKSSSGQSPSTPSAGVSSVADSEAGSVPDISSTDRHSRGMIDREVRKALKEYAGAPEDDPENEGTVYLVAHAERTSYKIFYRGLHTPRKHSRDCYSQPDPSVAISCINKSGLQSLVLAQFQGRVKSDSCGYDGCSKRHTNWIDVPLHVIEASLHAWKELLEVGYDSADIPKEKDLSQDEDRWAKWARETAAVARREKEAKRKEKKGRNKKKNAKSKRDKAGKARKQEPPSDSDEEEASFQGPRRIPSTPSDSPSDSDSRRGGDVRPGLLRRMSTLMGQTGRGFGKVVKKFK